MKNDQGEVIYRAVTDENGQIPRIPVTPGRYTFHEVLAPEGYALREAEQSFTVDESGNVTGDTVLQDDYTRVTLLKQNENGLPLAGVELALQKEDGSMLMTAVSDELGIVTFEKIPFGSYTIVETAPLSGYLRSEVNVCLTVDGSFVNPIQPLATIVNRPAEILLHKVDTEGNPLAGAVFALLNGQGETVQTAVSDENGSVRFPSLWTIYPPGNGSSRWIQPDGRHFPGGGRQPDPTTDVYLRKHSQSLRIFEDGLPEETVSRGKICAGGR